MEEVSEFLDFSVLSIAHGYLRVEKRKGKKEEEKKRKKTIREKRCTQLGLERLGKINAEADRIPFMQGPDAMVVRPGGLGVRRTTHCSQTLSTRQLLPRQPISFLQIPSDAGQT